MDTLVATPGSTTWASTIPGSTTILGLAFFIAVIVAVFVPSPAPFQRIYLLIALLCGKQRTSPLRLRSPRRSAHDQPMRWTGPNDEAVDVIRLRGNDGIAREVYRLRRHGRFVANCASLEDLAEHVDLATLRDEE